MTKKRAEIIDVDAFLGRNKKLACVIGGFIFLMQLKLDSEKYLVARNAKDLQRVKKMVAESAKTYLMKIARSDLMSVVESMRWCSDRNEMKQMNLIC